MNESASITGTRSSPVWPNGYAWRYEIRLPARPGGGTVDNLLLPFAAQSDEFKSVARGGRVESASGHDIRFEGGDGAKLGHVLVSTGTDDGAIAGFVNIASRTYEAEQSIFLCIGKSGLRGTEESAADAGAGGWLFVYTGAVATDYSGNGRPFTDGAGVSTDTIGPWPAGRFNGSTDYRARRSTELHALSALSYFVLLRSDMPDTAREALHIATGSVADLSLRKPSGNGFRQTMNVGGVSTELATGNRLCRNGVGHAMACAWHSGEAPTFVLDGATPDLPLAPGVAIGTSSLAGTLEVGRGGLATPNYGYWAGAIGPFFACDRRLPRQALEEITAALAEPRLAYGLGAANAPPGTDPAPVERPPVTTVSLAPYMGRGFGVSMACVNLGNTRITKPLTYSMKAPRTGALRRLVLELASNNASDYEQDVTIGGVAVPKGTKSYGAGPIDVPVQFVEGKAPRSGDNSDAGGGPPSVPDFSRVLAAGTIVHDRGDGRGGGGAYKRAFQAFAFASPVPVVAGRHYHVVVRIDPNKPNNANSISINAATYRQGGNHSRLPYGLDPRRRFGPYWGDDDAYTLFSQTGGDPADPFWIRRDTYMGGFDWHYTDGFTFGPGYRQGGRDMWEQCPIAGANRVRQRWRCVLPATLSFRYVMFWAFYLASGGGNIPAGNLTLTLHNETDGGSVSASLPPSTTAGNAPDSVPRWTYPGDVDYADWCRFDFGGTQTLAPGKTYRIEATAPPGYPYRTGPIQSIHTNPLDTRDCDGSPTNVWRALPGQPDDNVQAYAQRSGDGGSSWVGMTLFGTSHDRRDTHLPIYFEAL